MKKPKYLKTSDPTASNKFVLNEKIEEFAAYAWVILLSEKKKKKKAGKKTINTFISIV